MYVSIEQSVDLQDSRESSSDSKYMTCSYHDFQQSLIHEQIVKSPALCEMEVALIINLDIVLVNMLIKKYFFLPEEISQTPRPASGKLMFCKRSEQCCDQLRLKEGTSDSFESIGSRNGILSSPDLHKGSEPMSESR